MIRTEIKSVLKEEGVRVGQNVFVSGWIQSIRKSKTFCFVVLNDGSCQNPLQIIVDDTLKEYESISKLLVGSCLGVEGELAASQGKGQSVELKALRVIIYGETNEDYPLQKKATSLEFLRENAHLRARTKLFSAIFRVRHHLAMATHKFFSDEGFYYLNSPILTAVDAEGAGEMFSVTKFDLKKAGELPKIKGSSSLDFSQDYFGKETSLCVTGQLEAECFALGMGKVYTFGPTFRAENSNTSRHLSEFWMIEPEAAFMDLEGNAALATKYVKYLIQYAFDHAHDELEAIQSYLKFSSKSSGETYEDNRKVLENVVQADFVQITYTQAIDILESTKKKFEFPVSWGAELQSEHERFLTEEHFKSPVIVTDYPKDCKAFYMKQNDDNETVRAMDVLVPGIGEIIGGSQREENLEKLQSRIKELGMNPEPLWWYLDLRKFGSAPHSGFGLGFERAIQYITGMKNIRDVIAFPRTPKNCDF